MLAENSDGTYIAKIADFGLAEQQQVHSCFKKTVTDDEDPANTKKIIIPYLIQPPEELLMCYSQSIGGDESYQYAPGDVRAV